MQDGALVCDSGKTVVFDELDRHGDHDEWGGVLPVDETGSYRKMYNSSVQGTLCESETTDQDQGQALVKNYQFTMRITLNEE